FRNIADVLVLGAAGQDLATDHQERRRDNLFGSGRVGGCHDHLRRTQQRTDDAGRSKMRTDSSPSTPILPLVQLGNTTKLSVRKRPLSRPGCSRGRAGVSGGAALRKPAMALADREAFPCCRDHWVVPVGDEKLETCISPASAGGLFLR